MALPCEQSLLQMQLSLPSPSHCHGGGHCQHPAQRLLAVIHSPGLSLYLSGPARKKNSGGACRGPCCCSFTLFPVYFSCLLPVPESHLINYQRNFRRIWICQYPWPRSCLSCSADFQRLILQIQLWSWGLESSPSLLVRTGYPLLHDSAQVSFYTCMEARGGPTIFWHFDGSWTVFRFPSIVLFIALVRSTRCTSRSLSSNLRLFPINMS